MLASVNIGKVRRRADTTVEFASGDGVPALAAPSSEDLAVAGRFGLVGLAASVGFGGGAIEDAFGSLERDELGASDLDLDAQLTKGSGRGGSITSHHDH